MIFNLGQIRSSSANVPQDVLNFVQEMSGYKNGESAVTSMGTDEDPQIRESAKDLLQLSLVERQRRVDTSIESAAKDTIIVPLTTGQIMEATTLMETIERPPVAFVIAKDGTQLGYHYRPSQVGPARAIHVMFSLNTPLLPRTNIYMTKDYPVDSYIAFPRGYGSSSGKRGYSKHRDDYFKDMADIIEHIRKNAAPGIPIILGGFILSTPLVTQFLKSKYYVPVDGIACFGMFYRGCSRLGMRGTYASFRTKVRPLRVLLSRITKGRIYGRSEVGRMSINDDLYMLMPGITATLYGNMASIILLKHPDKVILDAKIPFYALYGNQNELIDEKSAKIFDKVLAKDPRSKIEYIDGGMVILVFRGWTHIGKWITETFLEGRPVVESRPPEYKFVKALDGQWLQYSAISESKQPHCSVIYYGNASIETLHTLSNTFNLQVFHFIPREGENGLNVLMDDLLQLSQFFKANWPAEPVVLAGEGAYAGLIARYSVWGKRVEVNGYLILSPKLDPSTNSEYMNASANGDASYGEESVKGNCGRLPDLDGMLKKIRAPLMMLFDERSRSIRTLRVMDRYADELSGPFTIVSSTAAEHVMQENVERIGAWVAGISSLSVSSSLSVLRMSVTAPLTLADLEVIQILGVGSFGKVWLVKHHETNAFLALKVIEKSLILSRNQITPVKNERRILKEVSAFPFIVPFVGTFQDSTRLFILMDYNIGGEIYALLGKLKRFPEDMARFYAAEMVLVLQYMHERKIAYRDLKSENTMIDSLGHIRVIDFGFAAFYDAARPFKTFCGSPYYLAPEIIMGRPYGLECDYWSLGCWIYEMIAGNMPFLGTSQEQIYRRSLHADPDYPSSMFSPEATSLIKALLAKDPTRRLGRDSILDIKKHPWFRGMDWEKLRKREVQPPFQPEYSFAGDTSNFAYDQMMRVEKLAPMQPIDERITSDPFKDF